MPVCTGLDGSLDGEAPAGVERNETTSLKKGADNHFRQFQSPLTIVPPVFRIILIHRIGGAGSVRAL